MLCVNMEKSNKRDMKAEVEKKNSIQMYFGREYYTQHKNSHNWGVSINNCPTAHIQYVSVYEVLRSPYSSMQGCPAPLVFGFYIGSLI